ncbi:MAG: hypothetical protein ABJ308_15375 [Halieaceae bacterium]
MMNATGSDGDRRWDLYPTLIVVFAVLPVIAAYFFYISIYAVNIPRLDDYSSILLATLDISSESSFTGKLGMLFRHHNEHIIALNKLLAYAYYGLFDAINLKHLVYIGNTLLLVTLLLISLQIEQQKLKLPLTLFAALMLLQPQSWASVTWAMASISNFGVWPVGFLALWLAHRSSLTVSSIAAIFALALCACFIQGNGLIAYLLCGVLIGLKQGRRAQVIAALWLLFGLLLYSVFLSASVDELQIARSDYAQAYLVEHPLRVLIYALSVMGVALVKAFYPALILGFLACGYVIFAAWHYLKNRDSVLALFAVFVALSIIAASLFRAYSGVETGIVVVRYYVYSQLLWTCILVDLAVRLYPRITAPRMTLLLATLLTLALVNSAHSYHSAAPRSAALQEDLSAGMERWLIGGGRLSSHLPNIMDEASRTVLRQAVAAGLYDPTGAFPNYRVPEIVQQPGFCQRNAKAAPVEGSFRLQSAAGAQAIKLTGWLVGRGIGKPRQLILCGERQSYRFRDLPWSSHYFDLDTGRLQAEPYGFELLLPRSVITDRVNMIGVLSPSVGLELVQLDPSVTPDNW